MALVFYLQVDVTIRGWREFMQKRSIIGRIRKQIAILRGRFKLPSGKLYFAFTNFYNIFRVFFRVFTFYATFMTEWAVYQAR